MLFASLLVAACIGCKTVDYTASSLPEELRAAPAPPSDRVNLETMVGSGVASTLLGPDDLIQITIVSGSGAERVEPIPARIAKDGTVMVPLVGSVPVSGLDPVIAEKRIAAAAIERGIYRQPHVTLTVTEPALNRVTVLGAVERPGVVRLPRSSCDLASALAAAGGLAENASTHIEIMSRGAEPFMADDQPANPPDNANGVQLAAYNQLDTSATASLAAHSSAATEKTRIDVAQVGAMGARNRKLDDSDVIMVLPKEVRVIHVTGLVKKPAQFEVEEDKNIRVLDAVAMAGGASSLVADKVFVIRQLPSMPAPSVIKVSMWRAKRNGDENLVLAAGDFVSVESTPATMTMDAFGKFFRMTVGGSLAAF
jgi:polysaccharide biosynthesis/export protein